MANLQTGFTTFLALPLSVGATTATLGTVPTATQGRLHLYDGSQEEWVSYTGVSGVTVTGLTRNLSQTADPATGGTGLTWIAGTTVDFVAMHDQIVDKTGSNTFATGTIQTFPDIAFTGTTTGGIRVKNLTTAQRDAIASPLAGQIIYNTTTLVMNQYIAGAWTDFSTGTTAAASTTVAGKVEIATQAENTAGTATGATGALLSTTPDIMATTIQRGEWLYAGASATGNDTYVVIMTPALAAYTTGMIISFKTDVANTGACSININGLGAKNIKTASGQNPLSGEIPATSVIGLQYDGTNFVVMRGNLRPPVDAVRVTRDRGGATGVVTYNHTLGRIPTVVTTQGILLVTPGSIGFGYYNNGNHFCVASGTGTVFTTHEIDIGHASGDGQKGVIQNLTTTTFDISWTRAGASSGTNIEVVCVLS